MLDQILKHKEQEVAKRKSYFPIALLESSLFFQSPVVSMREYICRPDKSGIIAEFKRKSPSKGLINPYAKVEQTTIGYMQSGASALSVLTDEHYFGGSDKDLKEARKSNYCPILRKDFIIDEYQIIEAKSIGADCILLIAAALDAQKTLAYSALAHQLGMEVFIEIHNISELELTLNAQADLIGVNNRNLKTMEVNPDNSLMMVEQLPEHSCKVAESGIKSPEDMLRLKQAGYQGFLIGERFMSHNRPDKACHQFIELYKSLINKEQ